LASSPQVEDEHVPSAQRIDGGVVVEKAASSTPAAVEVTKMEKSSNRGGINKEYKNMPPPSQSPITPTSKSPSPTTLTMEK
jgi:hypothetical protein